MNLSVLIRHGSIWLEALLWPLAVVFVDAELTLLKGLSPLPTAISDPYWALRLLVGLKADVILRGLPWVLLAAVAARLIWKIDPRQIVLAGVLALLLFAGPGTEIGFTIGVLLGGALLFFVGSSDQEAEIWFYRWTPMAVTFICLSAGVAVWSFYFPLREVAGRHLEAAIAALIVLCGLAAVPWIVVTPGGRAKLLVGVGALAFGVVNAANLDANLKIEPKLRRLGAAPSPSPVILIVIDTLRADALSYRSDTAPSTPNIDALARESAVFENAIAPSPWTFPSMTSNMTGIGPLQNGPEDARSFAYPTPDVPTLASYLANEGYRTRAIVANHLLYRPLSVASGFQRIDTFADDPFGESEVLVQRNWFTPYGGGFVGSTEYITEEAIEWIAEAVGEPSFLWLHYFDPHYPYLPPPDFLRQKPRVESKAERLRRRYEGEVRYVDREVGRFLDALKAHGLYDDALIILTSDHGEEFGEHGGAFHGGTLYQELLHVPLLLRTPGGAERRIASHVPTHALLPTVLDLLEIRTTPHEAWPPSLTPLLAPAADDRYDYPIVSGQNLYGETMWSVTHRNFKYVAYETGREELFNLQDDPFERNSALEQNPVVAEQARAALKNYHSSAERILAESGLSTAGDGAFLDRMRSLGYIQ